MRQEIKNGIIITITILLIIIITYFTTAIFLTGEIGGNKKDNKNITEGGVSLDYDNVIIAGKTFSMVEETYMVIFFSEKNSNESLKNYLSLYDSSNKEIKLYKVNLDEAINNFVKGNEKNVNATQSSDLKINGDTLITITNGKITSYVDDESQIIELLN